MQPSPGIPRPMTVVYAFLDFNDGGAQRLALRSACLLDRARFAPRVLCVRGRGPLVNAAVAAGIPVDRLGRLDRPFDLGAVPAIARWLRSAGADVVHVPLYSRAAPYVRAAARLAAVPLTVAHEHCRADPPPRLRRWVDRLLDRLLASGTRYIAVSQADRADLIGSGVPPASIHVIYPGVDSARFAPRDPAAARAALGLPPGRPIILVPARLHPMKRHVDLLAALPVLVRRVPDVLILCAGDGPLRRVLPPLAAAAGLTAHVRFLGARDDMPDLLAAADAVALPSAVEGLPAAIIEAQLAGRCVVATAVGGVPEAVEDGVTGRCVPPRAPALLAEALAAVLLDPPGRAAMADRARASALARFDAATATRTLEDLYLVEIERQRGGAGDDPHPLDILHAAPLPLGAPRERAHPP